MHPYDINSAPLFCPTFKKPAPTLKYLTPAVGAVVRVWGLIISKPATGVNATDAVPEVDEESPWKR